MDLMSREEEDLSGVDRPGSKKPGIQASHRELLAQGLRYLSAASQDTHPAYGLVHASYARIFFEGLAHQGAYFPNLMRKAGELQEKWTRDILKKIPLGLLADPKLSSELRRLP
jgi:hypothetical protein